MCKAADIKAVSGYVNHKEREEAWQQLIKTEIKVDNHKFDFLHNGKGACTDTPHMHQSRMCL